MLIALSILLILGVLAALAYPVLQQARSRGTPVAATSAEESLAELLAERDAAFQAIRDLHFDHDLGKISDEDVATYETSLKMHAAESLRRLDAWEDSADDSLGHLIERQVSARRAALSRGDSRPCPECGRLVAARDQYCTGCGAALAPAAQPAAAVQPGRKCPSCGRGVSADDRFCPKCGHSLAETMTGVTAA
jgi:RNA polymerase subunit RPABC4/transcription elongation factor Spt4